jgi:Xaa-Pro aminopeptidase
MAISAPADRRGDRQRALSRRLNAAGLDALLVTHAPNIRYLTGFSGSAGMLLALHGDAILVVDPRYAVQAPAEVLGAARVEIAPRSLWEGLGLAVAAMAPGVLGYEADRVTVRASERIAKLQASRVVATEGHVEALRASKDPGEVDAIRRAAALALDALSQTILNLAPGQTELLIASRLEAALRERGSEWHPFQTIVASGPRSALPHARAADRVIEPGDLLLIDFGAQVDGYCSDLTRTYVVGRAPDARQREVYDAVRTAQGAAILGIRAGMTGREGDAIARVSLQSAGFGDAFRHSLGHGLGLEVHEDPRLAPTAEGLLPAGAVVTIEPGVYFEGWGGVRLEDDVFLSTDGPTLVSPGAPALEEVP